MDPPSAAAGGTSLRMRPRRAEVLANDALSPNLRLIRLGGPRLVGLELPVAGKFKVAVGDGLFRSYTPARWDMQAGELELVAHVHGNGPGSRWAATARPGDETSLLGPKESFSLDRRARWALMLGDETTLGLWRAVADGHGRGVQLLGAVELSAEDVGAVAALDLPLAAVSRARIRGAALVEWLAAHSLPSGPGVVYLSGHFRSLKACEALLEARGVDPGVLRAKAYWGNGRKGRVA